MKGQIPASRPWPDHFAPSGLGKGWRSRSDELHPPPGWAPLRGFSREASRIVERGVALASFAKLRPDISPSNATCYKTLPFRGLSSSRVALPAHISMRCPSEKSTKKHFCPWPGRSRQYPHEPKQVGKMGKNCQKHILRNPDRGQLQPFQGPFDCLFSCRRLFHACQFSFVSNDLGLIFRNCETL